MHTLNGIVSNAPTMYKHNRTGLCLQFFGKFSKEELWASQKLIILLSAPKHMNYRPKKLICAQNCFKKKMLKIPEFF